MSCLMVSHEYFPQIGGIQQLLHQIVLQLREVLVVAPASDNHDCKLCVYPVIRVLKTESSNVIVRLVEKCFGPEFGMRVMNTVMIHRFKADDKPDIIFVGHVRSLSIGLALGRRFKVPVVLIVHGLEISRPFFKRKGFSRLYFQKILHKTSHFLVNSHFTAKKLADWHIESKKIQILPLGVDVNNYKIGNEKHIRERFGLEQKIVLLTVGRLVERKGHDTLIRAMPKILDTIPNLSYAIVGDGPNYKSLMCLAENYQMTPYIQFIKNISDSGVVDWYHAASLFVMPCRELANGDYEGFGLVFLEAAAAGLPVVAGRSGGAPEAILPDRTGVLVDPENPEQLAETIIQLLKDSDRMSQMRRASLEWAANHSWENAGNILSSYLREWV